MAKKNITINYLAVMVQKGFEETDKKIEDKFGVLSNEMKIIRKHQIAHTIHRDEFEKLESRIDYLENILNLHPKN